MTARTRRRFRVTLLALACLLLAQWSIAAHACPAIQRAGERIAHAQLAEEAATRDCHGVDVAPDTGMVDSALCVKHCADESNAGNSGSASPAAVGAPPLVMRAVPLAAPGPLAWRQASARFDATAPPIPILYCVSLT